MHGLLACSECMSLDSWALGCPGSGNTLFQRQISSIFRTNGIWEEIQSYSHSRNPDFPITHFSPFRMWIIILFFFSPPLKPRCQGRVMYFVGGGGNIAIATALPPSFCVLYWKHQIVYGISISYLYAFLRFRFLDVETNPGPRRPVPCVCRILCRNVRDLAGNLSDLTVASSQYDIKFCSETVLLWDFGLRYASRVQVACFGFGQPVMLCRGKMPWALRKAAYIQNGYGAFHQPKFQCGCCKILFFRVCGISQNLYVFSIYRNPDLDDWIFDCLHTSMAAVQPADVRASFLFVGDLKAIIKSDWGLQQQIVIVLQPLLRNCVWLRSVCCQPAPYTCWNTWPSDDWCSWPITGCCCSTHTP